MNQNAKRFSWIFILIFGIFFMVIGYILLPDKETFGNELDGDFADEPAKGYVEYSENLNWIWNDVNKAIKIAKKENKFVLIDFWAEWCYWCIEMDKNTYADERVGKILNKNFVYVKIDHDRYPKIGRYFEISGLPTVLILDKDGNQILRLTGYRNADEFIEILKNLLEGFFA